MQNHFVLKPASRTILTNTYDTNSGPAADKSHNSIQPTNSFDGSAGTQIMMQIRFGASRGQDPSQSKLSNKVRTTKYTLLTWAPLSLFYQFKRAANVYFLVITVLTTMSFSPKRPVSMIMTFSLVLIFTMFKEAYEDYQRYKSDNELNNRDSQRLNYETQVFEKC